MNAIKALRAKQHREAAPGRIILAVAEIADELRELRRFREGIDDLRHGEGDSVMIMCDNPDGPPNNAVGVCADWTDWKPKRFEGESVCEALDKARRAKLYTMMGRAGKRQATTAQLRRKYWAGLSARIKRSES